MDLSTIAAKLDHGLYKNAWQFCDDMWQMLENAWLYNGKNGKVYKHTTKLSELFVDLIDPVMKKMGYCCGQKRTFTSPTIVCYGDPVCTIERDRQYWSFESSSTCYGMTFTEKYTYCQKCFDALPAEGMALPDNSGDMSNTVPKASFSLLKNNDVTYQPVEKCKYCHRKWHSICALYDKKIFSGGFVCSSCREERNLPLPENKFTAKQLPHCKLSQHLEGRVNDYMKKKLSAGKKDREIIIRVLSVADKEFEVKTRMKSKYCGEGGFPSKFPYKSKAIYAFEVIDGAEVCLFGFRVQEYGSNCPEPNARRVYISDIDSVNFPQLRQLRTEVHHEILLEYLDYVRNLGYSMAHMVALPRTVGDDSIFNCHPIEQKTPKPKRLQDWFKSMFEKGVQEGCIVEYKDIYEQTPCDVPYFEGDLWPTVIEDCIREADSEAAMDTDDWEDISQGTGDKVADRLLAKLEKHKETFFTLRLLDANSPLATKDIVDPDALIRSELMDDAVTFPTR